MKFRTYLHFLLHCLRLRVDPGHRVPLTMNLQVTGRCCNRCRYCDYDRPTEDALTLEVLEGVFRDLWRLGGRRVGLTGGEPLLLGEPPDIVRSAKDRGLFVTLSTTGVGAESQLEALRAVDQVMLSFDGPTELREYLSGPLCGKGTDEAIELFRKENIPFWTTTVLTRPSLPHIDWIVDHARRHGAHANFTLMLTQRNHESSEGVKFHPAESEVEDLTPTNDEIRGAVRRIMELKKGGAPIGSSLPFLEELLAWPDYAVCTSARPSRRYRCLAGRASCELLADGMLYPCAMPGSRGVSILEEGFASAFKRMPPREGCLSCIGPCWMESNMMFSLNVRTILSWMKSLR